MCLILWLSSHHTQPYCLLCLFVVAIQPPHSTLLCLFVVAIQPPHSTLLCLFLVAIQPPHSTLLCLFLVAIQPPHSTLLCFFVVAIQPPHSTLLCFFVVAIQPPHSDQPSVFTGARVSSFQNHTCLEVFGYPASCSSKHGCPATYAHFTDCSWPPAQWLKCCLSGACPSIAQQPFCSCSHP